MNIIKDIFGELLRVKAEEIADEIYEDTEDDTLKKIIDIFSNSVVR